MPPRPEDPARRASPAAGRACWRARRRCTALAALGRCLDADLSGAKVLLRTSDQLFAALGLIELDGVAARIVIAPPDVKPEHLPSVIERAAITVVVSDDPALAVDGVRFEQLHLPEAGRRDRAARTRPNGCCSPPAPPACPRWWRIPWKA